MKKKNEKKFVEKKKRLKLKIFSYSIFADYNRFFEYLKPVFRINLALLCHTNAR